MRETRVDEALTDREAEATTDETLKDMEERQEIAETSATGEIPAPDSAPNKPPAREDEGLI
jgi:hypothetical protein